MRKRQIIILGNETRTKTMRRALWFLAMGSTALGALLYFYGRSVPVARTHVPLPAVSGFARQVIEAEAAHAPVRSRMAASEKRTEGPGLIDDARPKMLDAHPDVAQFRWLEHKVLRTRDEQKMREEMLADSELIQYSRNRLLTTREGPVTREDELERLYRVEFLAAAIEDPNNPGRAAALEAIEDVIMANSIHASMPLDLQKSLAGDKMELYMALLHDAPQHAEDVARLAENTPTEALVKYSSRKYQMWNESDEHK